MTRPGNLAATRLFLVIVVVACLQTGVHAQNQAHDPSVHFVWAFGAMVGPDGNRRLITVDRDLILHSGDRIKFLVAPRKPCFVYLFHLDGPGALSLLYPSRFDHAAVQQRGASLVPPDNRWYALDEATGTEKFYLVASREQLHRIESAYRKYQTEVLEAERRALAAQIIQTIKELRRKHLRNTGTVERPVHLGGNFRDIEETLRKRVPDLSTIAVVISAPAFYSRTFTIEHR